MHFHTHTHMDGWLQMDSRVWAGAADADRTDAKRAGTDSKTFLCPQLQDRAESRVERTQVIQIG